MNDEERCSKGRDYNSLLKKKRREGWK